MVAELEVSPGNWEVFLCERPPDKLLDEIFQKRLEFYDAAKKLNPNQIWTLIPITFPTRCVVDPILFPGVGHLNVESCLGKPYFSLASWIVLCQKIAAKDMTNLQAIFDICTQLSGGVDLAHLMEVRLRIE